MKRLRIVLALCFAGLAWPALAQQEPAMFRGADLKTGAQLIAGNQCATCHQRQVGGDGSAIYRPAGRINSPAALVNMVEQCNMQLGLSLFPDEIASMAAVLNRRHYHFTK